MPLSNILGSHSIYWLLGTVFWILMLVDCINHEIERGTWLWILIILPFPGVIIYFCVRFLPRFYRLFNIPEIKILQRYLRNRELELAEWNASNVGNSYHFVILGNILCELRYYNRASQAYAEALSKEPENLEALWGNAFIVAENKNFIVAKAYLEKLLMQEPVYKFGEGNLLYCRVLFALNELKEAKEHLNKHIARWNSSEARFILATILAGEDNKDEAGRHLRAILEDIKGHRGVSYRKDLHWALKARKLMRTF